MVFQGEHDPFLPSAAAGIFQVEDGIIDGILLRHSLWCPPCKDTDNRAAYCGIVVDPGVDVDVPLFEFRSVWQGEHVAYGTTAYIQPMEISTTLQVREKLRGDFIGEKVGGGKSAFKKPKKPKKNTKNK